MIRAIARFAAIWSRSTIESRESRSASSGVKVPAAGLTILFLPSSRALSWNPPLVQRVGHKGPCTELDLGAQLLHQPGWRQVAGLRLRDNTNMVLSARYSRSDTIVNAPSAECAPIDAEPTASLDALAPIAVDARRNPASRESLLVDRRILDEVEVANPLRRLSVSLSCQALSVRPGGGRT